MPKANTLTRGQIVRIDGDIYRVKSIDVKTPAARGAATLYKIRFTQIQTYQKLDLTFRGNDDVDAAELDRRPATYLYRDGDFMTFMDTEDFSQYALTAEALGEQAAWLTEGQEGLTLLLLDGQPLSVELPVSLEFEIEETAPVMKGATATNRNKPARLSNGVEILVPEYLTAGERVRVNTETGLFMGRVTA